jgi:hypothetical protein
MAQGSRVSGCLGFRVWYVNYFEFQIVSYFPLDPDDFKNVSDLLWVLRSVIMICICRVYTI